MLGAVDQGEKDDLVFKAENSGSDNITVESIVAHKLEAELSSLGSIHVKEGQVDEQSITLGGSGNYEARRLKSDRAKVKISSIGSATLAVSERLEAEINDSGGVSYIGSPEIKQEGDGPGELKQIKK